MKLSIVGSGNIAYFFGTQLFKKGHQIETVYSTNHESGQHLANELKAKFVNECSNLTSDIILLAIPDDALNSFCTGAFQSKKIIYFSGTRKLNSLDISSNLACIWPIYSINKNALPENNSIPMVLQTSNEIMDVLANEIASELTDKILKATDEQKAVYHLAAVFVNNFTNHMMSLAELELESAGLSFEWMRPIILNTAEKVQDHSPKSLQTGPALRQDLETIESHLALLSKDHNLASLYQAISRSIQDMHVDG